MYLFVRSSPATVCLWRSEGSWWMLVLPFHSPGSRYWTQAIGLDNKRLHLISHLVGPPLWRRKGNRVYTYQYSRLALNSFCSPGCLWACASAASTSPPNAGITVLPHQAWCEAPTSQKVVIGFCTSPASLLCSASGLFLWMFCLQGTGPIFTVKKIDSSLVS